MQPIPARLNFWMKHDTWTHAQAALLLCGLDPKHCEISNEGQLMGNQAQMLDGYQLHSPDAPPLIPPMHPLAEVYKVIMEGPPGGISLETRWRMASHQVQDCLHWLQASPLAERAFPQHYLAWAKRKGLAEYIFTALGDNLASVLDEVDEPSCSFPEPPVQPAPPAMDPAPRADRPSPEDYLLRLAALFDPLKVAQLETMFPAKGQWKKYAERAQRNGLIKARAGRGVFNPLLAAEWWVSSKGPSPSGWEWERCLKVLERSLPARSAAQRDLFPKYD